jgi:hypothetical protein
MQKMKEIQRHYSEQALRQFGEEFLKPLLSRALQVAIAKQQRHLVSTYLCGSVAVVTDIFTGNRCRQKCCMPTELSDADKAMIRCRAPLVSGGFVLALSPRK